MHKNDRERCRVAMEALERVAGGLTAKLNDEVLRTLSVCLTVFVWLAQFEPEVADAAVNDIKRMGDEIGVPSAYLH